MQNASYGPSRRGQQGQLDQLQDGRWRARYREGGREGKRPSRIFATKREASDWLRERLDRLDQQPEPERNRVTVDEALDRYLAAHEVDAPTLKKLRSQLKPLRETFGERRLDELEPYELQAWRKTLPPGSAHYCFRAARQALSQFVVWRWLQENPSAGVKNPRPRRREVQVPAWELVLALADEIDSRYEALPVFAAGTGLRPEEWIGLHRSDLDVAGRVVRVRRVYSSGRLVELGAEGSKTWRQRRDVPLRQVVVDALAALPPRIDTPALFPAPRGGHLDLERFYTRFWVPAIRAAGVDHFPPKDMRHTYASECLAAGIDLFTLSKRMGTSLKTIDENYGHLLRDATERELGLLDAWDARAGR